jgi:hypothetical protein
MHAELHRFLNQLISVVTITLLPVVLLAFVSLPLNLNRHPGDAEPHSSAIAQHMT